MIKSHVMLVLFMIWTLQCNISTRTQVMRCWCSTENTSAKAWWKIIKYLQKYYKILCNFEFRVVMYIKMVLSSFIVRFSLHIWWSISYGGKGYGISSKFLYSYFVVRFSLCIWCSSRYGGCGCGITSKLLDSCSWTWVIE